jgi:tRNA (guanine-N(7)-)-methyltransferase subunit TRM82
MKQLIHTADSHLIVGFGDRAFVVPRAAAAATSTDVVTGVVSPDHAAATAAAALFELVDPENNDEQGAAPAVVYSEENGEIKPREIQAVAVAVAVDNNNGEGGSLWCAVARYNKRLAVYHVPIATSSSSSSAPIQIQPKLIHKTTKRASCLSFADVENALQVVIAGDLAGDAVAFSLQTAGAVETPTPPTPKGTIAETKEEKEQEQETTSKDDPDPSNTDTNTTVAEVETNRHQRLLLGHTASMLTGVKVTTDNGVGRILTSDRDEKIRVSLFPDTHVVDSFLLGHEAFVSSLDVTHRDGLTRCATSSGDGTIRLWDYAKCQELAVTSVADGEDCDEGQEDEDDRVPSRVAIHPDGASVAVIYDKCVDLDIYSETHDNVDGDAPGELLRSSRTPCAAQPLGLTMLDAQTIVVVTSEPTYIQAFRVEKNGSVQVTDLAFCQALRDVAVQDSVDMPATILEKDKQGNVKMQKLSEQRSSVEDKPWNNKGRIDIARERTKRAKRRKREAQEEKTKAALSEPEALPVPPS